MKKIKGDSISTNNFILKANQKRDCPLDRKRVPHFKHKKKQNCIYGSSESEQHIQGKQLLFNYFNKLLNHKAYVGIEHFISETGQIADIFIEFENGVRWAVEYQRSNVSLEEIQKRKKLCKSAKIKDIWITGENLVTDLSLTVCSITNTGQKLIHGGLHEEPSLITFNPRNQKVNLIRGLSQMNHRSYTLDECFEYELDDIAFNLWGRPFCFDDYNNMPKDKSIESGSGLIANVKIEQLFRANLKGSYYTFKHTTNDNYQKNEDIYINIDHPLNKFIPVEMRNLLAFSYIIWNHAEPYEGNMLKFIGICSSRWEKYLDEQRNKESRKSLLDDDSLTRNGMLFLALNNIYESKFQTVGELEKQEQTLKEGGQIPFYSQNYYLKKYGLIENDFDKNTLDDLLSLEDCLYTYLKILRVKVTNQNVIDLAIEKEILLSNELETRFTNGIFCEITKRLKKKIPKSENYHDAILKSSGLFD
jgi:hypothetical protein